MRPTDTTYLRDWIAAGVVAAIVQSDPDAQNIITYPDSGTNREAIVSMARSAYVMADAMLLVRQERAA